jgi:DNA-binding NarL/FixJ family response regulator
MTTGSSDIGPKRIVVADDHAIWLSGLKADLGPNFTIVGEATDADEAIEIIERTEPDLVLSDLHMPGGGGLAVARAVAERFPVVMLTVSNDEADLLEAVAAGAVGYLVKSTAPDDLRDKLWRAASGEPVFSPSLAALVLTEFRRLRGQASNGQGLSDREREVLQLVARGHTYAEIGDELFISPKTVENHVRNILHKLKLTRKNELIRYAVQHGID